MIDGTKLIHGDCLEVMRDFPADSMTAIVTDPPYGLDFMGAHWDGAVPGVDYWREALRVAKPGAYLLCFGGTRTFHRMACAIEDAGWEIRDCVMWVYGSGFPKSMDIGKKLDGWQGYGTCLKPAWEPIIMARKPLDGTVAHNVLEYGTGALNIDGCRVKHNDDLLKGRTDKSMVQTGGNTKAFDRPCKHDDEWQKGCISRMKEHLAKSNELGRFPANLAHDGSDEVVSAFPDTAPARIGKPRSANPKYTFKKTSTGTEHNDNGGSAARFFYCAKASKADRAEYNNHPTVKPNALMRWLVRLVCPPGGTVLDPFMGSGSTGCACVDEGANFVGIERDAHYVDIARRRIESRQPTLNLDF